MGSLMMRSTSNFAPAAATLTAVPEKGRKSWMGGLPSTNGKFMALGFPQYCIYIYIYSMYIYIYIHYILYIYSAHVCVCVEN